MKELYIFDIGNVDVADNSFLLSLPKELQVSFNEINDSQTRLHKIFGYIVLRYALKQKGIQLDQKELSYNENGKPYIKDCPVFFNVSHSFDFVVVGLSNEEIGVDVEKIRSFNPEVAKKYFEVEVNTEEEFYYLWTKKEAIIKYHGGSVVTDLKNTNNYQDYQIESFIQGDYYISLCSKTEGKADIIII